MLTQAQQDIGRARTTFAHQWGWLLAAGIAWLIIALVVLRFTSTSVATVGVLLGAVFLVAAVDEFYVASVRRRWAWAHVLLGILFVVSAVYSFASPVNAFWSIASVFGLLLILAGTLDIVQSTASRPVNSVWGLGLTVGILEVLLGFWASQQVFPTRGALLLLWVGLFALFRGITDIVLAFEVKSSD
jgi:uncharacterized membrane protein HdeD (DUF308 family)